MQCSIRIKWCRYLCSLAFSRYNILEPPPPPLLLQVHVIIDPTVPESSGEATVFVYDCVLSDYNEDDEDMSDTDPEDEWESVSV